MMDTSTERAQQREDAIQQEIADYQWLMSSVRGRRIINRLLKAGMVDEVVFNGNSRDAYMQGRRSLACEIQHRVKQHAFPDFIKMLQEQHDGG